MSSEKRKKVTILDILNFLTQENEGSDPRIRVEQFQQLHSIPVEVAEGMFNVAEELGYIDHLDSLTEKGKAYLEDCYSTPGVYGTLTLIRGLPGAGKTELAKSLESSERARGHTKVVHVEADQFMVDENGHYQFQVDKVKSTNVACIAETERYLRMGYSVIVSNAFAQYWEITPYYDIAAGLNIKTVLIEMQSQFISERRSAKTRQMMVEKWEHIFLPRSWASHNKEKHHKDTEVKNEQAEAQPAR